MSCRPKASKTLAAVKRAPMGIGRFVKNWHWPEVRFTLVKSATETDGFYKSAPSERGPCCATASAADAPWGRSLPHHCSPSRS